ncbi:AmmeMemoRadiSam system protein B [Candidatus Daviesbacteria bacterium]|nr:AmmeMemoRadiSam system protein B [Candidatus Daviesbacteria bacterium]
MREKNLLLIFLFIIVFLGLYFAGIQNKSFKEDFIHEVKFYDGKTFFEGVQKSEGITKQNYHIRGGIVPHHLYPGFIIADFFKRLSYQNPKTIVLIGPNHYEKGNFKALTSLYIWETPYGVVNPDTDFINNLLGKNLLKIDEEVLPEDHSVSGILPFIKYYIGEGKVVPILLKRGFTEKESDILASNIEKLLDEDTVVIAAVDFSHYLTSEEAKKKDDVTLKIMQDFDYPNLYLLNNDYLDSPSSIGVLLKVMQKLGSTNSEVLFHTNSGEMQKNNGIETTSYFSIAYYGN